jgi:RNA polymerase sigma-70 factor (ECF subfamily)
MPIRPEQEQFDRALTQQAYARAWQYACRLCATREDSEDLLQDALVRAYRGFGRLRHPERFSAWLISIVRNCYLSRRASDQRTDKASYWQWQVQAAALTNPLSEPLAAALAQLPAAQREILSLFYLDGLTLDETGWVLGLSPQVVGQRLYRARKALRRVLRGSSLIGVEPQRCKQ